MINPSVPTSPTPPLALALGPTRYYTTACVQEWCACIQPAGNDHGSSQRGQSFCYPPAKPRSSARHEGHAVLEGSGGQHRAPQDGEVVSSIARILSAEESSPDRTERPAQPLHTSNFSYVIESSM